MNNSKIQRCKLVSHNICKSKTYSSKSTNYRFSTFWKRVGRQSFLNVEKKVRNERAEISLVIFP